MDSECLELDFLSLSNVGLNVLGLNITYVLVGELWVKLGFLSSSPYMHSSTQMRAIGVNVLGNRSDF
jgi:hypothetical protein